jgi:two-component system phosphate regulon sensor histidine kinase PhoR
MTHEFKTPLSSILIASTYLKQQETIKTDEKLDKYTQIIINQGNKLNNHIEKILSISKWDTIPMTLEKHKIEIIPIIESVIENINLKYDTTAITIKSISPSLFISADEFHFSNLVYNILENAIKYSDGKPEIIIKISKTKNHLLLQFIDNGTGISEKDLPFVFDKFYRIPGKKNHEVNGFGLGLFYVKKNNSEKGITVSILAQLI